MGIKNLVFVNGQAPACDDEWLNSNTNEGNNLITSSDQTPSLADPDQSGKAVANYVHTSNFYDVTGTADAIVLSPTASFEGVTEYQDGALYRFRTATANTTTTPTCNINSLGVKNIKAQDGSSNILVGDISTNKDIFLRYDGTNLLLINIGFTELIDTPSSYSGEAGKVPVVNSGEDALEFTTKGKVVQFQSVFDGIVATGTTVVPYDNTKPQITEGDEYMTLAITPTNASNKLVITSTVTLSHPTIGTRLIAALFQDADADALSVGYETLNGADRELHVTLKWVMVAGTTSSTTFRIRCGGHQAGTLTFNGSGGNPFFNGTIGSNITITEEEV